MKSTRDTFFPFLHEFNSHNNITATDLQNYAKVD